MIAVDIHDTIADYILGMISTFGQPAQWQPPLEEMFPYVDRVVLKDPEAQGQFMRTLDPIAGSAEVLWRFKLMELPFFYYTATPEGAREDILWWLINKGFPPATLEMEPTMESKRLGLGARDYISMVVDDHPDIITYAANLGITTYVIDKPWNRHIDSPNRVLGWKHLYGLICGHLGVFRVPNEPRWSDYGKEARERKTGSDSEEGGAGGYPFRPQSTGV